MDEDLSAGINSGEGVAHTRPRSALETATPPGNLQAQPDDVDDFDGSGQLREPAPPTTQEEGNRTAVGGRVAREVLAFMAAIERGDLSTAVGLPVPPGVTILENLPGLGARRSTSAPALERVVKNLPRVQVREFIFVRCFLYPRRICCSSLDYYTINITYNIPGILYKLSWILEYRSWSCVLFKEKSDHT